MYSPYKQYSLSDLLPIIDSVALMAMMTPGLDGKKADGTQLTMAELANKNAMVAWHNDGVKELAMQLKRTLSGEDEQDEDGAT